MRGGVVIGSPSSLSVDLWRTFDCFHVAYHCTDIIHLWNNDVPNHIGGNVHTSMVAPRQKSSHPQFLVRLVKALTLAENFADRPRCPAELGLSNKIVKKPVQSLIGFREEPHCDDLVTHQHNGSR